MHAATHHHSSTKIYAFGEHQRQKHRLTRLYQKLSRCLETISGVTAYLEHSNDRACCVILEEDLTSLVEECEGFLVREFVPSRNMFQSFEARSICVMEEALNLLHKRCDLGDRL